MVTRCRCRVKGFDCDGICHKCGRYVGDKLYVDFWAKEEALTFGQGRSFRKRITGERRRP